MAVDVDMLNRSFDSAHEKQLLVFVHCSFAKLSDRHTPHVCTCEILIAEDKLHMMCFMLLLIGLWMLASSSYLRENIVPLQQSPASGCGNRILLQSSPKSIAFEHVSMRT
jgi:hypothetical protein